jgi:hypothetical protein
VIASSADLEGAKGSMYRGIHAFCVIVSIATALPARGDFRDGNKFLVECTSLGYQEVACYEYIKGIADVLVHDSIAGYRACVPPRVLDTQLRDVVVQYLQRNAPQRHYGAAGLVAEAIAEAFPCR